MADAISFTETDVENISIRLVVRALYSPQKKAATSLLVATQRLEPSLQTSLFLLKPVLPAFTAVEEIGTDQKSSYFCIFKPQAPMNQSTKQDEEL